ncbi:dTDP-4-dehydrorhamnose 3,5-epimerase [Bdellovibrio sp. HCB209]|uniref:dTDP-4-dehydrorhamnose 3,5-epimerase n=1 Tax=Bdellovibrio sp. HCB209 TaxID=3394354 RepID=UPI0039B5BDAE
MKLVETPLKDCYIVEPSVFGDSRGFFMETFNQKKFNELTGSNYQFVQDNHSRSSKGVLRGLHYQIKNAQGKLVRVTSGKVLDVAVDLRKSSSTYGKSFSMILDADDKKSLWIPPGFAHGFLVLSDTTDFLYKTTDYYSPEFERTILWNDPALNIDWGISAEPLLSLKDKNGVLFNEAETYS